MTGTSFDVHMPDISQSLRETEVLASACTERLALVRRLESEVAAGEECPGLPEALVELERTRAELAAHIEGVEHLRRTFVEERERWMRAVASCNLDLEVLARADDWPLPDAGQLTADEAGVLRAFMAAAMRRNAAAVVSRDERAGKREIVAAVWSARHPFPSLYVDETARPALARALHDVGRRIRAWQRWREPVDDPRESCRARLRSWRRVRASGGCTPHPPVYPRAPTDAEEGASAESEPVPRWQWLKRLPPSAGPPVSILVSSLSRAACAPPRVPVPVLARGAFR